MENTISLNELNDVEIDGVDMSDYPDFCDAHIVSATWKTTGVELTEDELDNVDGAEISERVLQDVVEGKYTMGFYG